MWRKQFGQLVKHKGGSQRLACRVVVMMVVVLA